MVIGDAVVGNRITYRASPSDGWFLTGYITGTNGAVVQVMFDQDIPINAVSEVPPSTLTLNTDGGYFGSLAGIVNYQ